MARRAKGTCLRYKTRKVIQDYGPAKTVRRCVKRAGGKAAKRWCVYKGKSPVPTICHKSKRLAKRAAARLKKTCKRRIRVKRG